MQVVAWGVAGVLGVALIVFIALWVRSRIALKAALDTLGDVHGAMRPTALTTFADNVILRLLVKGELHLDGKVHSFGVVQAEDGAAMPFLVTMHMEHLAGGDSFSARTQASSGVTQLYKVELGAPLAGIPAAESEQPTPPPAPTTPPTPAAPVDFEDLPADRTVMFAPSRRTSAVAESPLAGFTYLHVQEGPDAGTKFPLPFARSTIGRELTNTVALADSGSSRLHCEIVYEGTGFALKDAQSTNGTLCNGEKVTHRPLEFGDRIEVADTVMVFSCEGFDLMSADPNAAISAYEKCVERQPDFLLALKNLAFLLTRDVRRQKEADPLWKRITQIEQSG